MKQLINKEAKHIQFTVGLNSTYRTIDNIEELTKVIKSLKKQYPNLKSRKMIKSPSFYKLEIDYREDKESIDDITIKLEDCTIEYKY